MNELERTRIYLITEYPFYSAMLSQCVFSWTGRIQTAAVGLNSDGNVMLLVNKEFFTSLSEHERVGLLMHEMLHLVMNHLTRGKELDNKTANIAMDIAINQYIPKDFHIKGMLFPELYNFTINKSFEYYYLELLKRKDPTNKSTLDDHSDWGKGLSEGTSNSEQSEGKDTNIIENNNPGISDEIASEIIERMVAKAVKQAEALLPGSTPMHVKTELQTSKVERSKVNWKQRLRSYVGRYLSNEYEGTRNKPNRRLGFVATGKRRLESPKVLIAVDQSGSVNDVMISQFFEEMNWILKAIADKTEIVFFDTEIAHKITLDKFKEIPKRYASGGTNFQTVFDYANIKRPDLLIVFSDGEATMPVLKRRLNILWTIAGDASTEHLKGSKIKLN